MPPSEAEIEAIQLANFRSFGKFMNKYGPNIRPEPKTALRGQAKIIRPQDHRLKTHLHTSFTALPRQLQKRDIDRALPVQRQFAGHQRQDGVGHSAVLHRARPHQRFVRGA